MTLVISHEEIFWAEQIPDPVLFVIVSLAHTVSSTARYPLSTFLNPPNILPFPNMRDRDFPKRLQPAASGSAKSIRCMQKISEL